MEEVKKLAEELNNCEYRRELTENQIKFAKENNLVVVYGASDDLTEFEGAISDEFGVGELYFDKKGNFFEEDELSFEEKSKLNMIHSFQTTFRVKTDIPHSKFDVLEDGEFYGTGIVFSINNLK